MKLIPVIMMSGNKEMDSIYACIDKGAIDFLIKPIRPGAVKGLISSINLSPSANDDSDSGIGLNAYDVV